MSNNIDEKLDLMMKNYCNRESANLDFVYRPKKNYAIKRCVLAASLAMAILIGGFAYAGLNKNSNYFTITACAATAKNNAVLSKWNIICKDDLGNTLSDVDSVCLNIGIDGNNVADISVKSENSCGFFDVIDGNSIYSLNANGENCSNYDCRYRESETISNATALYCFSINEGEVFNEDFFEKYDKVIIYKPCNNDGYCLYADELDNARDDVIKITVTYTDGTTETQTVSVTYPNGEMMYKIN